jgi:uncharacterized protein DUF4190
MAEPSEGPPAQEPPPPPHWPGAGYAPPPPQPYAGYYRPPVRLRNGLGVASLVIAIVAIFPCVLTLGPIPGVLAVTLGFAARRRVKRGEANNGRMAMAGIVLGFVAIVVSSLALVYLYPWWKDQYDYIRCTSWDETKGHQLCAHYNSIFSLGPPADRFPG